MLLRHKVSNNINPPPPRMHVNISCAPFLPGTFSSSYLHPGRRSHQLSRSKLGEDAKQEAVTPDDRTATTQREIGKKIEDQIKTPMCPIHSPVPEKKNSADSGNLPPGPGPISTAAAGALISSGTKAITPDPLIVPSCGATQPI
jgi:hypothetical protein